LDEAPVLADAGLGPAPWLGRFGLRRDLGRRITTSDGKIFPVQSISETTLVKLLEITLALFLEEKLGERRRA